MKRKKFEQEGEEEEERLLISTTCKVVEYLEPVMSTELLFKLPDNSAFDFDYTQSSIWSPLVPRNYSPMDLELGLITPRKLTFGLGLDSDNNKSSSKKMSSSIKKKKKKRKKMSITPTGLNVNLSNFKLKQQHMKNKVKVSEFSPTPIKTACVPFPTKGWNKVLKAAAKHFKKKKKKDPTVHVKLSNYLRHTTN